MHEPLNWVAINDFSSQNNSLATCIIELTLAETLKSEEFSSHLYSHWKSRNEETTLNCCIIYVALNIIILNKSEMFAQPPSHNLNVT